MQLAKIVGAICLALAFVGSLLASAPAGEQPKYAAPNPYQPTPPAPYAPPVQPYAAPVAPAYPSAPNPLPSQVGRYQAVVVDAELWILDTATGLCAQNRPSGWYLQDPFSQPTPPVASEAQPVPAEAPHEQRTSRKQAPNVLEGRR